MAAIYSNGGNRWNILGFNFTKRDVLSSVYKISMVLSLSCICAGLFLVEPFNISQGLHSLINKCMKKVSGFR
jgi:hypothetical protein